MINVDQEFNRIIEMLNDEAIAEYTTSMDNDNTFEVSTDKFVTISGGINRLYSLQTAYQSLFVDNTATEGRVKQADGTLVMCSKDEWDVLLKAMRDKGSELFSKRETLLAQIDALTIDSTLSTILNTVWANV